MPEENWKTWDTMVMAVMDITSEVNEKTAGLEKNPELVTALQKLIDTLVTSRWPEGRVAITYFYRYDPEIEDDQLNGYQVIALNRDGIKFMDHVKQLIIDQELKRG